MKSRKWLSIFLIPLFVIHTEACTSNEDILNHLETVKFGSFEELTIKSDYTIRHWDYAHHGNQLETDGVFAITWMNKNLEFSQLDPCSNSIKIRNSQNFWKPHVYFPFSTEIAGRTHDSELVVHADGNLTLSQRLKQQIPCVVNSDENHFSNLTCTLEWKYLNVTGYQKITYEESNVTNSVMQKHSGSFLLDETTYSLSDGEIQRIVYSLKQHPQDILINFYAPSLLFLIPPWLTLLLGPMAITRACILMSSLILLSIHYHTSYPVLLDNGGVHALSVWKLFTYFYVIAIVCELIVITLLASMGRSKTCCFSKRRSAKYEMEPLYEEMNDLRQRKTRKTRNCCRKAALLFDIASFIFFGCVLALFCYGYYAEKESVVKLINEFEMDSLNFL